MDQNNNNKNHDPNKIAEAILAVVMQSFAEYSFVHTPEQLQNLVADPESDPIFLHEVKEDIVEILTS